LKNYQKKRKLRSLVLLRLIGNTSKTLWSFSSI